MLLDSIERSRVAKLAVLEWHVVTAIRIAPLTKSNKYSPLLSDRRLLVQAWMVLKSGQTRHSIWQVEHHVG